MRRAAFITGLSSATFALTALCGCSNAHLDSQLMDRFFSTGTKTLANDIALDRALHLSALTQSERPFHLVLNISPPPASEHETQMRAQMQAQVEVFWMNPITYRTVIRSPNFSQTRIVNGRVVEEHNTGNFYPRWIQNFVDGLFDPAPRAGMLASVPGTVPIGPTSRACITHPASTNGDGSGAVLAASPDSTADETAITQVCFEGPEPRLSSGITYSRYVSYDDFAPFGTQLVPRTLVNDLPVNLLLRGHITVLEPLPATDEPLLKAHEFTLPANQIRTTLVSRQAAESLLATPLLPASSSTRNPAPRTIYIRTDRTGKVREAYRNSADHYNLQDAAVSRALTLKFKPLRIDGVPQQMEAPIAIP
jgi:hypothetical protein